MKKLFGGLKGRDKEDAGPLVGKTVQIGQFNVRVETLLGRGGYSDVYLAADVATGQQFALKHMRLQADPEHIVEVQREAKNMAKLRGHANILRLHAVAFAGPKGSETDAFFLLDHCPGTLIEVMQRFNFLLDDALVVEVFSQVCSGVAHMHRQNPPMCHRDLKAENVLQLADGSFVLCDFGSATTRARVYDSAAEIATEEEAIRKHTTPAYRAPEMWDLYTRQLIDTKADIWALGVLLYVLTYGRLPFQEASKLAVLNGKYELPTSPPRPHLLRTLIKEALTLDPAQRPDIGVLLARLGDLREVVGLRRLPEASLVHAGHEQGRKGGVAVAAPLAVGATMAEVSTLSRSSPAVRGATTAGASPASSAPVSRVGSSTAAALAGDAFVDRPSTGAGGPVAGVPPSSFGNDPPDWADFSSQDQPAAGVRGSQPAQQQPCWGPSPPTLAPIAPPPAAQCAGAQQRLVPPSQPARGPLAGPLPTSAASAVAAAAVGAGCSTSAAHGSGAASTSSALVPAPPSSSVAPGSGSSSHVHSRTNSNAAQYSAGAVTAVGSSGGAGSSADRALAGEMDLLKAQVASLGDQNHVLVFRVKQLEEYVVNQKESIAALQAQIATLTAQVTTLAAGVQASTSSTCPVMATAASSAGAAAGGSMVMASSTGPSMQPTPLPHRQCFAPAASSASGLVEVSPGAAPTRAVKDAATGAVPVPAASSAGTLQVNDAQPAGSFWDKYGSHQ